MPYASAVALLVEHNTPEPAPLTDTSARVVTVNYTGNGGGQTIDFAGMDVPPTALLVMPVNGVNGVEPIWWWESRQGAGSFTESLTSFGRIWPQKGKFHVAHATVGNSYNANGVNYVAIALFDPSGRYVIPFAVSKPTAEDDYTQYLRYPHSGELASTFTPDFVFGGVANGHATDTVRASTYRGPGHVGDLTAKLGVAQASDADRIQVIGAGTVQFGTLVGNGSGDQPFWAGRVSDGVSPTRLMAVTSYVGDGTASRNIALDLSAAAPVFALVVPTTTAAARVYRVTGDTTGRNTTTGNAVTNSIPWSEGQSLLGSKNRSQRHARQGRQLHQWLALKHRTAQFSVVEWPALLGDWRDGVKTDDVVLSLSRPEALVFFELLSRAEEATEMPAIGEAERRVIWRVHAQLERTLQEPLAPDYVARLQDARSAVLKVSHE